METLTKTQLIGYINQRKTTAMDPLEEGRMKAITISAQLVLLCWVIMTTNMKSALTFARNVDRNSLGIPLLRKR